MLRALQMQEQAKPQPERAPVAISTPRQDRELELEQEAGRRALERHKRHFEPATREKIGAKQEVKQDATPGLPGFKV